MTTFARSLQQDHIIDSIQSAKNINDLMPILQCLCLSTIKEFITQQINQSSNDSIKTTYYESSSIDAILPDDTLQHIASFNGVHHPKSINKQWKRLSEKNENNHLMKMYKTTAPTKGTKSTTWIIHPTRQHLNFIETELGYRGPMTLSGAFREKSPVKKGDRLLIHDGNYQKPIRIEKDISLVGLGQNVIIEYGEGTAKTGHDYLFRIAASVNVRFENLNFTGPSLRFVKKATDSPVMIECAYPNYPNVTIRDCKFTNFEGHVVQWATSATRFDITHCLFANVLCAVMCSRFDSTSSAPLSEMNISDCLFRNCGSRKSDEHAIQIEDKSMGFNCFRNEFEDCVLPPIVESDYLEGETSYRKVYVEEWSQRLYKLKDNVLRGNNVYNNQTFTANDVYEMYDRIAANIPPIINIE